MSRLSILLASTLSTIMLVLTAGLRSYTETKCTLQDCLDLRRVIDIHFHRSIFQMCLNRGTITIHSSNDEMPQLQLTTFGTKQLYHDLKEVRHCLLTYRACMALCFLVAPDLFEAWLSQMSSHGWPSIQRLHAC